MNDFAGSLGLYLLCKGLCGSKYSDIRNALTHRYLRVFRLGRILSCRTNPMT
jgi:hypothetical protein